MDEFVTEFLKEGEVSLNGKISEKFQSIFSEIYYYIEMNYEKYLIKILDLIISKNLDIGKDFKAYIQLLKNKDFEIFLKKLDSFFKLDNLLMEVKKEFFINVLKNQEDLTEEEGKNILKQEQEIELIKKLAEYIDFITLENEEIEYLTNKITLNKNVEYTELQKVIIYILSVYYSNFDIYDVPKFFTNNEDPMKDLFDIKIIIEKINKHVIYKEIDKIKDLTNIQKLYLFGIIIYKGRISNYKGEKILKIPREHFLDEIKKDIKNSELKNILISHIEKIENQHNFNKHNKISPRRDKILRHFSFMKNKLPTEEELCEVYPLDFYSFRSRIIFFKGKINNKKDFTGECDILFDNGEWIRGNFINGYPGKKVKLYNKKNPDGKDEESKNLM